MARKDGTRVRLYSRPGNDLTIRFHSLSRLAGLRSHSVILDGEAVACDDAGIPSFDRLRHRRMTRAYFYTPST
jgi:ATP-dependent DNA ligase